MPIVVQKYGGSSVADIARLRAVAARVVEARRAGNQVVVVVSAMGKTTENLLSLAGEAALPPCFPRPDPGEPASPPRRELDMLVSTGERVSMALLSIAIQAHGLEAISFTGSQSGIITNDRHFDARILEVRPHRIEDELERGRIVIVAGYQGMSYRREITTLGRGGSDTTAVALAAALAAERCEIYSDVDGVYSADPRSVLEARHIAQLDYATMQEMAESGAKVLNAQAVEWAKRHRVVIHARRTGDAGISGTRETLIGGLEGVEPSPRAVVTQRQLVLLEAAPGEAPRLLAAAQRAGLPLRDLTLLEGSLLACASLLNVPDLKRVRAELSETGIEGFRLRDGFGSVSLIGVDVGTRPETPATALAALPVQPLWLVGTPLRVSAIVPEEALQAAERAWHRSFVCAAEPELLSA